MANTPDTSPVVEQAPPSAKSAAKPISLEQLGQELTKSASSNKPEPKEAGNELIRPNENDGPIIKGFEEAMREKVMNKKKDAEAKEEAPAKEEKKVEEVAKKVEPAKAITEDDPPEEQRKVMPHDKPDTGKRIKYFLREIGKRDERITKFEKDLEAALSRPQTAANVEEVTKLKEDYQKTQDELIRFRRRYDVENDAEFKSKYHEPVTAIEKSIEDVFKKYNLGDATLKAIKDEGGFAAFSRSRKVFEIPEADPENPGQTRMVPKTAAQLAHSWLNSGAMAIADAEDIKASIGKQQLLKSEGQAAMQRAQDEAKTFLENQTAEQRKASEQAQAEQKRLADEYAAWAEKAESETEFLKDIPVPANATPEETKSIQERNELNKELRGELAKHPTNAIEYGQLKLRAAEAKYLQRTVAEKDTEIAKLKEQVKKSQGAMRTTNKGGSLLVSGGQKATEDKPLSDPTDWKSGLNKAMKKLAAGGDDE